MDITVNGEEIRFSGSKSVAKLHGWNLFVPGIRIGNHNFKRFNKNYAYVFLPDSKNWVFLRTAIFLEVINVPKNKQHGDGPHYVLVHDVGKRGDGTWDVPKGQVEYKEYQSIESNFRTPRTRLHGLLKEGITRELLEEAKINIDNVLNLREIPNLVLAGHHGDLPKHFQYQYHTFEGKIDYSFFEKAKKKLDHMRENPHLIVDMPKDIIEKDNIALWSPSMGLSRIIVGDPQKLITLYMNYKGL